MSVGKSLALTAKQARALWISAQRLDTSAPFGSGPEATQAAVEHLGYVQIDTINVIERCHHHILFSRIPEYRRADLIAAQSHDKSVFEYWTHALSYVPTRDVRYFLPDMQAHAANPVRWFGDADPAEFKKIVARIRRDGPISIRDVDDDELIEKSHPWASKKPSKRLLQSGFYTGTLTISERTGMLKTYELIDRHFGWPPRPRPASSAQRTAYLLERALRSQGLVSVDSMCHLDARSKPAVRALIEKEVRAKRLVPVHVEGNEKVQHWMAPAAFEAQRSEPEFVHILSPFDPLIIQRKRTSLIFGYDHLFEAYLTREKRKLGYFTLPVLVGDEIVAGLDLKTDRAAGELLIQSWHWMGRGNETHRAAIEDELGRFERFQLGD